MALIGVLSEDEGLAKTWARRLDTKVVKPPTSGEGVVVFVGPEGLRLGFSDGRRGKPFQLDYLSPSWRTIWSKGLAKSHIFRRALGEGRSLLDLTGGFAEDAMLALSLGFEVTAVERCRVLVEMVREAVDRAGLEDETLRPRLDKFTLLEADSRTHLREKTSLRPDVIYLDPMFQKPKRSAKSPKEMQLLQELLESSGDLEAEPLLELALGQAGRRVVVKRPLKGKALLKAPSHALKGQSVRYDVYLV